MGEQYESLQRLERRLAAWKRANVGKHITAEAREIAIRELEAEIARREAIFREARDD